MHFFPRLISAWLPRGKSINMTPITAPDRSSLEPIMAAAEAIVRKTPLGAPRGFDLERADWRTAPEAGGVVSHRRS